MQNRRNFIARTIAASLGIAFSSFKKFGAFAGSNNVCNAILGRPTASSIVLNMYCKQDAEVFVEYGKNKSKLSSKTAITKMAKGTPVEFSLGNLPIDQRSYYCVNYKTSSDDAFVKDSINSFHTQRKKGSEFVFTITADSHLGTLKHCNPELYQLTLNNVAKDNSDLHFSLGDDFRASRVQSATYEKIEELYFAQREHLHTLCNNVPFFFILGNHELEAKAFYNGTDNCLAAWSANARKKFVPNPLPDNFYSGNTATDKLDNQRQNYYAFEWGDVLFVTMDVFWYSNISSEDEEMREQNKNKEEHLSKEERIKLHEEERAKNRAAGAKKKDQWSFTIGNEQYNWLQQTLQQSRAKYKFVMGHHVLGSTRGAVEWASTFEWGGKNRRGITEFKSNRPDWEMPIHDLFVKHKVTAFIQGHDHLFARQDLDGIAYITCPMCGDPGYNTYNSDGYLSGDKLSNTGHLKMIVNSNDVQMQYIKAVLPKDEIAQGKNGQLAYAWSFVNKKNITTA